MARPRRRRVAAACAACAGILLATAAPAMGAGVTSVVTGRVLEVTGSNDGDRVKVTCEGGNAKVNGSNPAGGSVGCGAIHEIDATTGPGDDVIDFSGIDSDFGEARFPGFGVGTGTGILAGAGDDRYIPSQVAFNVFIGEGGNDRAKGGPARDVLNGAGGDDTLDGVGGRDTVIGGPGDDRLFGGLESDLLNGGLGDDKLYGEPGADVLGGGPGMDKLRGGPGRDRLVGGADKDDLNGGAGKDTEIEKDPK